MLLSMILGDQSAGITNEWTLTTDSYDNTFISNESIRQRIRLGKKVKKKFANVYKTENAVCYEIAENTFLSNNNKNMNLSLMNFWSQDPEVKANHKDDSVLYITFLNSDYKMLDYSTHGYEVIQTYRKKGVYQGLAITFKECEGVIFTMLAKDLVNNAFVEVNVSLDSTGNITTTQDVITDKNEVNTCKNKIKKIGNKIHHFMMDVDGFPTNTFIIDDKYAAEMTDLLKNVPNAQVISLIGGSKAFAEDTTDEEKAAIETLMQNQIVNERVRAVTTVGVRLPKTFCRTYSILYLFNYDIANNRLTCVKSN